MIVVSVVYRIYLNDKKDSITKNGCSGSSLWSSQTLHQSFSSRPMPELLPSKTFCPSATIWSKTKDHQSYVSWAFLLFFVLDSLHLTVWWYSLELSGTFQRLWTVRIFFPTLKTWRYRGTWCCLRLTLWINSGFPTRRWLPLILLWFSCFARRNRWEG